MSVAPPPAGFQLALDLLNTLRVDEGRLHDRLAKPADGIAWLAERQLAQPWLDRLRASPADASHLLLEMRRLREGVDRAASAFRSGAHLPPETVFCIDRVLSSGWAIRRLSATADGARVHEEEHGDGVLAVLAPVALGAARLLTTVDPRRLRRCAAECCDEWFVDTSKGGRRRWCSMERCGNRAKVAKHRRRARVGREHTGI